MESYILFLFLSTLKGKVVMTFIGQSRFCLCIVNMHLNDLINVRIFYCFSIFCVLMHLYNVNQKFMNFGNFMA